MGEGAAPGRWFHPGGGALRGAALVLHGLNLDPERMRPLIALLNAAGIAAFLLELHGHGGNFPARSGADDRRDRLAAFQSCRYALWAEEAIAGFREVRRVAAAASGEAVFVGFSYGALLGCDLLVSRPEVAFARMVLLAPALRLRPWDRAVRMLSPFPGLVLPTFAPEGYAANPGTPVAAYNALFATLKHFDAHLGPRLNIPTLVFVDPGDELISFEGLQGLVSERRLDRWRIHPLRVSRPVLTGAYRHLIVDEETAGRRAWAELQDALFAFLGRREGDRGLPFSSRQNPASGV